MIEILKQKSPCIILTTSHFSDLCLHGDGPAIGSSKWNPWPMSWKGKGAFISSPAASAVPDSTTGYPTGPPPLRPQSHPISAGGALQSVSAAVSFSLYSLVARSCSPPGPRFGLASPDLSYLGEDPLKMTSFCASLHPWEGGGGTSHPIRSSRAVIRQ
jgi:hypothetical protein